MALRVLLADESPTIKKVMQISLQDFGIDLKAVQLGIDVIQVAEQFQPDIIFCDVLLQKKSGYDVAQELKANPKTKNIPVVLMWSGFMELDEAKFRDCRAEGQIEKPFDSTMLRDLVQRLVKSTKGQSMSNFLEFPDVTSMTTVQKSPYPNAVPHVQAVPPAIQPPTPPPVVKEEDPAYDGGGWTMDSFEDLTHFNPNAEVPGHESEEFDSFQQKPLQAIPPSVSAVPPATAAIHRQAGMQPMSQQTGSHMMNKPKENLAPPPASSRQPLPAKISPLAEEFTKNQRADRGKGPQGLKVNVDTDSIDLPEDEEISHSELLANISMHQDDLDKFNIKTPPKKMRAEEPHPNPTPTAAIRLENSQVQLTQEQLEFIIRSQSKEIIERVVWKMIPELADKLIKDEIRRLMDETKL